MKKTDAAEDPYISLIFVSSKLQAIVPDPFEVQVQKFNMPSL